MDPHNESALGINPQKDHFASEHVVVSAHRLIVEKLPHWVVQLQALEPVQQLEVELIVLIKIAKFVDLLWQFV